MFQVIKKKLSIFQAVMLNAVAALVPVLGVLVFVIRHQEEEPLEEFLWSTLTCQGLS